MTTYENVALPFRVMGRSESSYRKEVIDLLRWVGLGERMDALPPILSGGEKQRAAIARAVISRPQLLLADEPTGSVDPTLGRRLLRLFIELNKSGTAVVIATHDITLMEQYDARPLLLHQGRLHLYEQDRRAKAAGRPRQRAAAGAGESAHHVADRAARLDLRSRAGRGRRDHDLPCLDHDRRGAAGQCVGCGMAVGCRQRNHHPGAPAGG